MAIQCSVQMISLVLISVVASMINAHKISGKIDLAIIVPASKDPSKIISFKKSIRSLSQQIEMGEDKVRVAVVEPVNGEGSASEEARILFGLSGSQSAFEKWVDSWEMTRWDADYHYHNFAFKLVRERVFDFKSSKNKQRAKMVIHVLNGKSFDKFEAESMQEAKKLREAGALIYVNYDPKISDSRVADAYVGEYLLWRAVRMGHSDQKDMFSSALQDVLKKVDEIERDLCTYCKFGDSNQVSCIPSTRPTESSIDFFDDKNARCQNVSNLFAIPCPKNECETECTRQWPWADDLSCNNSCDGEIIGRDGAKVPAGMENCQRQIRCTSAKSCTKTSTTADLNQKIPTQSSTDGGSGSEVLAGLVVVASVIVVLLILLIVAIVVINNRQFGDTRDRSEVTDDERRSESDKVETGTAMADSKADHGAMNVSLVDESEKSMKGSKK